MDLLSTVETLRKIQAECNAYDGDGPNVLAHTNSAWGALDKAMRDILTEYFRSEGYTQPITQPGYEGKQLARLMADRVIDEVYDNGESVTYNVRLLIKGQLSGSPIPISREDGEKVLVAVKRQCAVWVVAGYAEPTLRESEPDNYLGAPWVISWEEGPFEWAHLFPHGGIEEEFGFTLMDVNGDLPTGLNVEPINSYVIGIWRP